MSEPSQIGKLDRSFCKEVNRRNVSEVKNIKNNDQNTPMSIDIKIQNIKIKALIDTGAEISLIQGKVFNQTPFSKQLNKTSLCVQSVTGGDIDILGEALIKFNIKNESCEQNCAVVSNMSKRMILGKDFLYANSVRIYFDLRKLRINNTYVKLQDDVFVSSNQSIDVLGQPNSCIVTIEDTKFRTLIDTGAQVSLVHEKVLEKLKGKSKLEKCDVNLKSVIGDQIDVVGVNAPTGTLPTLLR